MFNHLIDNTIHFFPIYLDIILKKIKGRLNLLKGLGQKNKNDCQNQSD